MGQGWNLVDLYYCRNKILSLLKKTNSNEEYLYLRDILSTINDLINDAKNNSPLPELGYNERLSVIEKELVTFKRYYDLSDSFVETIYGFEDKINSIQSLFSLKIGPYDSYAKITGATLSNNQAFKLTKKFYQQFDPILLPTFLEAFEQKNQSVSFVNKIDGYNAGTSFYIDYVKKYFISVVKTKDPNKLFTLVHEYGHVISYILNPKRYLYCTNDMFDEVPAVFPEMLSIELNVGNYSPQHIAFEKYGSLVNVYNIGNELAMHIPYVDIWKSNGKDADSIGFINDIKEEFDEDKEDIDSSLDTYIDTCGTYLIAYIVSIELLNLYRRNKDKALEIYRNIINIPYTESTYDYITSELDLGSHLEEETSLMLDDTEKKLKKVGAFYV